MIGSLTLFSSHAHAQACQMSCGNQCYNSPNPSFCESMCVSRCAAGGGNQGGMSRPAPVWQPRFAAFAATTDNEYWGVSVMNYSAEDAAADAKARCEKEAKRACPTVRGTDGVDVALLTEEQNGKTLGIIIKAGETMSDAVNPMLAYCREHHPGAKCTVVYKHVGR
ncbi:MAG: DUF4189 domain-containing protein [Caulobacteraceae bacterium]|nr:DUF4189 domain-containing protein [Caulobacteraceae bacterium]